MGDPIINNTVIYLKINHSIEIDFHLIKMIMVQNGAEKLDQKITSIAFP